MPNRATAGDCRVVSGGNWGGLSSSPGSASGAELLAPLLLSLLLSATEDNEFAEGKDCRLAPGCAGPPCCLMMPSWWLRMAMMRSKMLCLCLRLRFSCSSLLNSSDFCCKLSSSSRIACFLRSCFLRLLAASSLPFFFTTPGLLVLGVGSVGFVGSWGGTRAASGRCSTGRAGTGPRLPTSASSLVWLSMFSKSRYISWLSPKKL
mmetsp:Transcript_7786/g.20723  ORF Transcript_7786/g.20723 Transcript_7786/m.20723 type:complete len:205 (-) Transcript_7786:171-785(-)